MRLDEAPHHRESETTARCGGDLGITPAEEWLEQMTQVGAANTGAAVCDRDGNFAAPGGVNRLGAHANPLRRSTVLHGVVDQVGEGLTQCRRVPLDLG